MYIMKMSDGTCKRVAMQAKVEKLKLSGSVGTGPQARNKPEDVTLVQKGLNSVQPEEGGPSPKLSESGVLDEATKAAIVKFQQKQFGKSNGLIVAGGDWTMVRLNEYFNKSSLWAPPDADMSKKVATYIDGAMDIVKAAEAYCVMAQPYLGSHPAASGGLSVFSSEERLRRLNEHFDLNKHPNQANALDFITKMYRRMLSVFTRPGNMWGSFIFENSREKIGPGKNDGVVAFTTLGGYNSSGEHRAWGRADSIFLTELMRLATGDFAIQVIVHELAHFVAPPGIEVIDHAYGKVGDSKMKNLTPYQKIHNAECYSNFAFAVKYGRESKAYITE